MTRGLAVEWAEDNICVNSIAPGWFHSKMLDDVMDDDRRKGSSTALLSTTSERPRISAQWPSS